MANLPPNVFNNLNQHDLDHLLEAFEDVPPPIQDNQNVDAAYEDEFVKTLKQDKRQHVIGFHDLKIGDTYNKVMDNDTRFDINQMEYVEDKYRDGRFLIFKNNLGDNYIILNSDYRFIPAYKMLPENYPNREKNKNKIFAIDGIHKDETSNDEDPSDSDMSVGGKKRGPSKKQKKFHFTSTQKHQHGGKKTVRHVSIKNGKGHKKVSHYRGNKLIRTIKKSLKKPEMEMIRLGKFIPGLFRDCQVSRKKGTTRHRRNK